MRKCLLSISSFCCAIFIFKSFSCDVNTSTQTYFLHMAHTDPLFLLRRSIPVKLFTHTPGTRRCQLSYTRILLPHRRTTYSAATPPCHLLAHSGSIENVANWFNARTLVADYLQSIYFSCSLVCMCMCVHLLFFSPSSTFVFVPT